MNLVGKIFTVLILVMSLVFMSFAVAVYATHKNWRNVVMLSPDEAKGQDVGLKWQLEDAIAKNQELKDKLDKMELDLEKEQHAAREKLLQVRAELEDQLKKNAALEQDLKAVTDEKSKAIATLDATALDNNKLRAEVDTLRAEIREAQKQRDQKMDELVAKTDNLLQAENELRMLKERMAQVQLQLQKANEVLRKFNLVPDPEFYAGADVRGVVLAVQGNDLIEISIGSDDGLNKGAYLRIFRADGSTYLGKAQVVDTWPDRAVCTVLKETQKGVITKGDRVSSGINDIDK